jgi:hypothetical protein
MVETARLIRCLIPVLVLPFAPLWSQDVSGGLFGRVVDADGQPLPDVQITLAGPTLQGERHVMTDRGGYFRALDLPVGAYTLRLARIGFRPVLYEGTRVRLGTTTEVGDVRLEHQVVELPEVRVSAETPAIDPVSTTVGSVLEAPVFELLPIGRDYQSMVTILPHANESFLGDGLTIGGSTGLENAYFVDGVNVTDPFQANGGTRLPYNFVQSVQVKNGGYEAEYGKALGGVVNAVTYSGGNRFEGNVFGFFSGSALADAARAGLRDLRVDRFSTFDVGVRLGGPIVRDRAWFSLAYNPRLETSDREIPGLGLFEDRFTLHMFAGKVTWRPVTTTNVELSVFGDPSTHHVVGPPPLAIFSASALLEPEPFLNLQEEGGATGALRLRQQIGQRVQVDVRVTRSTTRSNARPDTGESVLVPRFIDKTTNTWSGGPGVIFETTSHRTTATLQATAFLGRHMAKLGAEYEDTYVADTLQTDIETREDATLFDREVQFTQGRQHNRTPVFFLQDSWQASRRLVLNAGFRWSAEYLVGQGDTVAQRLPDEWQPRLGFVYQLGAPGTERLFGSYGRFYQQMPLFFSTIFYAPFSDVISFYSQDPRLSGVASDSAQSFSTDASDFPSVSHVRMDHFDEFTLGYERQFGAGVRLQARGIHRVLRAAFGFGFDFTRQNPVVIGNLGEGDLAFLPKASRKYSALEFTLARAGEYRLQGQVSYVFSRTYGNYSGLFASDEGTISPGVPVSLQLPEQALNSTGILPNDRTHVVKVVGSYRLRFGLTVGAFGTAQSGTPLNEFGSTLVGGRPVFLVKRGSAGRTPMIWDANLRWVYALPVRASRAAGRVVLDILHIGSPRRPTNIEQFRFLAVDTNGNQTSPNPNFGKSLGYQPPMAARLGFELDF